MDKDDVVDTLNDLINTCKDGEYGFSSCAKHAKSPELRSLFSQRATECQQAAAELQTLVLQYGGQPEDSGSVSGALHRGWVSVRGALSASDDKSMLDECERGEDAALARYREALRGSSLTDEALPQQVRTVIERQLQGVQRNHDQIKALRERERARDSSSSS
jgi:uncharacterized protein (TIGR02284 family)